MQDWRGGGGGGGFGGFGSFQGDGGGGGRGGPPDDFRSRSPQQFHQHQHHPHGSDFHPPPRHHFDRSPPRSNEHLEDAFDGPVNVLPTLRQLTALEDILGSLGPQITSIMGRALNLEQVLAVSFKFQFSGFFSSTCSPSLFCRPGLVRATFSWRTRTLHASLTW